MKTLLNLMKNNDKEQKYERYRKIWDIRIFKGEEYFCQEVKSS